MDIPELLPVEKSNNTLINDVKTNLIKMLVNRNLIEHDNKNKYINDLINIDNDDNDMEFLINIDNDQNYNTEIPNKKIYVKFFDYKIMSVSKNSQIANFITKYYNDYKIIIVENINPKTETVISKYNTQTEIFKFSFLKNNIVDHSLVPRHIVLPEIIAKKVKDAYGARNKNIPLILSGDPIAKYYNMKQNDICKIVRFSKVSGRAFTYRICVKSAEKK